MKKSIFALTQFIAFAAAPHFGNSLLHAGEVHAPAVVKESSAEITHEAEASYNASTSARSQLGLGSGNLSEQHSHFQYVFSYAVPARPIVRLGISYDLFDFDYSGRGVIPHTLQSLNLVAGLDLKIADVLVRIEAQPGFYGESGAYNSRNFNVPIVIGASYLVSKDFQWIAGLSINPNRDTPVMGGLGFRWKTSDRWVLNFVPPNPRIEYLLNDDVTLYTGAQIVSSTFRVGDRVGRRPVSRFDNAWLDYTEVRTGAGASWKFSPKGTLDVEIGCVAFRQFDYSKLDEDYQNKGTPFYGEVGLKMAF